MQDVAQLTEVLRAALLVAVSEGHPGIEELHTIQQVTALHPGFAEVPDARELLLETWKELKRDGMEACIQRVASGIKTRELQELAFRICAKVMAADGRIESGEAMVLGELEESFGFTPLDVKRLLATR